MKKISDKERLRWLLAPFKEKFDHVEGGVFRNWEKMLDHYYYGKFKSMNECIDAAIRAERKRKG